MHIEFAKRQNFESKSIGGHPSRIESDRTSNRACKIRIGSVAFGVQIRLDLLQEAHDMTAKQLEDAKSARHSNRKGE